jgi:hypothetical protein
MRQISWGRAVSASVVAFVVAVGSLTLLFGNPLIERLLFTSESGQSSKVLSVWLEQEPLPAVTPLWDDLADITGRGVAVQVLLLIWATALVLLYVLGWAGRDGPAWRRGLTFGVLVWVVVFLFFEAWVPFNLLGEPFGLVLVELALQLVAMVATGIAIALIYRPPSDQVEARPPR